MRRLRTEKLPSEGRAVLRGSDPAESQGLLRNSQ